jgi:excinuclease ABC subunit C
MQAAAAALEFERAADLRDMLLLLQRAVKERSLVRKSAGRRREETSAGLAALQQALGLDAVPRRIECFDISNISGTLAVASMVCALDGMPAPQRYRRFRIRTVQGSDDPAMIAEAVGRRYRRLLNEQRPLPDLVLVDGGITQVRAAQQALNRLGLDQLPLAGLAKRHEELIRERGVLRLPLDSPALVILRNLRDEAHRFAITYHRQLRNRRIRNSVLDEIPGIGANRKELILKHFGSVSRLRKASTDELCAVPGIGRKTAERILSHIRS